MEGYQQVREGEREGKGTGNKKHKWQVQNRQGEVKNSIGKVEAKELTYSTHGYELSMGGEVGGTGCRTEGNKGERKMGQQHSQQNVFKGTCK